MSDAGGVTRKVNFTGAATNELGRIASGIERRCSDLARARALARAAPGEEVLVSVEDVQAAKATAIEEILGRRTRWRSAIKTAGSTIGGVLLGAAITLALSASQVVHPVVLLSLGVVGSGMIVVAIVAGWGRF